MNEIKKGTWVETLIETYMSLGGEAHWNEVYPEAQRIRQLKGLDWTTKSRETIRDCVQRHSSDSNSRKRVDAKNAPDVFYAVAGANKGIWGLRSEYFSSSKQQRENSDESLYLWGLEGILKETKYLRRFRDQVLIQERKKKDEFTCQACGFHQEVSNGHYIIDVHHLTPLSASTGPVINSLDDLVCLCPNCHRIAHSKREAPLSVKEIRELLHSV
ncbi:MULTISPECIES: HNH endonuclease [unclassified Phaeobacter]|uniref:HNH endonuclease n=1 Tax=unclassified Phaeobacter TaxID=2621772 RepID=UPI003A893C4B